MFELKIEGGSTLAASARHAWTYVVQRNVLIKKESDVWMSVGILCKSLMVFWVDKTWDVSRAA